MKNEKTFQSDSPKIQFVDEKSMSDKELEIGDSAADKVNQFDHGKTTDKSDIVKESESKEILTSLN